MTRTALRYRFVEQAARGRHREQSADAHAAGRFAENRDVARIAAELRDIVADPFERRDLIEHAFVAARRNLSIGYVGEADESKWSKSIVNRDDYHVAAAREDRAVVESLRAGADGEAAAMNPDHHRSALAVERGRPDVEREAILGLFAVYYHRGERAEHARGSDARLRQSVARRGRRSTMRASRARAIDAHRREEPQTGFL